MEIKTHELQIQHDTEERRFFVPFESYEDAELQYEKQKDNGHTILNFKSTYVPEPLRNQGIASRIVEGGFQYADERGFKVKPTCPFVETFLERHEEYERLRV